MSVPVAFPMYLSTPSRIQCRNNALGRETRPYPGPLRKRVPVLDPRARLHVSRPPKSWHTAVFRTWLTILSAPARLPSPGARCHTAKGVEENPIRLPWVIFALLLAMCASIAAAFIIGETPYVDSEPDESGVVTRTYAGHGIGHPEFKTMLAGGPGPERHSNIFWAGLAFAVTQAAFFIALLLFGIRKKGHPGPARIPVLVAGAAFVAIFVLLFFSYRRYMDDPSPDLFLTLPAPTAWMIYGVWLFPIVFVFIYRRYFDSWFLTDEDMARFNAMIAEQRPVDEENA